MEIQSVKKLANLLSVSVEYLQDITSRKQDCYNPYKKSKKTFRRDYKRALH